MGSFNPYSLGMCKRTPRQALQTQKNDIRIIKAYLKTQFVHASWLGCKLAELPFHALPEGNTYDLPLVLHTVRSIVQFSTLKPSISEPRKIVRRRKPTKYKQL